MEGVWEVGQNGSFEGMDEIPLHEGHLRTEIEQKPNEILRCATSGNIRYTTKQIPESIDTKISIHLSSNPSSVDDRFPQFPSL